MIKKYEKITNPVELAKIQKSLAKWEKDNKLELRSTFEVLENGDLRPCFIVLTAVK